jgi:[ribosomal protein S5]-alanine N-acetyltransferase
MNEYFLETNRLLFRHWTDGDFALAHSLWGDAQVMKLVGGPYSAERTRERLAQETACQHEHGFQYWPIFLKTGEQFTGCCGMRPYKADDKIHELGVHLLSVSWGKGLAQEASKAVIDWAFAAGAAALFAGHHPDNVASRALLIKLGFRYTHAELYPPTGLIHPSYLLHRFP